jgi:FkbM family methyltransferase
MSLYKSLRAAPYRWLASTGFWKWLEYKGAWARGKGYVAPLAEECALLRQTLGRPAKLAIDIGGNIGDYTALWRAQNPALEIHVFEPAAVNIAKLKNRFAHDTKITVVPLALSDRIADVPLFADAPGSGMGSMTKRKLDHFNIPFEHKETIQTTRFEEYWKERLNGRAIDMVKIDVEGHEFEALSGFGEALPATGVIQFEFGGTYIDTRRFFQDMWYLFKDAGFDIYRITPFGLELIKTYQERDECFVYANYIAANRRR